MPQMERNAARVASDLQSVAGSVGISPLSFRSDVRLRQEVNDFLLSLDTNRDSSVSRSELSALQGLLDVPALDMVFAYMDTDMDQQLSWAECLAFAQANPSERRSALSLATKDEQCNLLMSTFDANNDGFLSYSEVSQLLTFAYGSAQDIEWFMSVVDTNRDGKVSRSELYAAMQ